MSAKDIFHEAVKQALEKEQWVITDDPLKLKFGNINFQIDLGAERVIAAEKAGEKIAVEIKSFLNPSAITDFYAALGQFLSYRLALANNQSEAVTIFSSSVRCLLNIFSTRIYSNCGTKVSDLAHCL